MPPPFDRRLTPGGSQRPSSQPLKRQAMGVDTHIEEPLTDGRSGLVVDIEQADREIVRHGRRPRHDRSPSAAAVGSGGGSSDGALQHVVGRRRFRPERALLLIGAAFVIAVLTKPWPTQPPTILAAPSASQSQPSLMARVAPSEPATAASLATATLRAGFADLCPTFGNRANDAPAGQSPGPGATPVWSKVDWGALTATDRHSAWGFATTVGADGVPGTVDSTPNTSWVGAGARPVYASVPLVCGQNVYAIAVTWPSTVHVSRLSFVYLGEPESPPYLPPAGFEPNAPVTPLPATIVVRTATASNGGSPNPTAARSTAGPARSGEFYIPPVDGSSGIVSKSAAAAWQSHPWSWPYGAYQVTVTSDSGTTNIVLDLMLT